jgi:FtsP/CotA-like multicopper oxidase with cupredoxin domain
MRVYFIAAEERPWDYAPRRRNELSGRPFGEDEKVFVERRQGRIGSTYVKSLYRGYTDASFSRPAPRAAEERANGMLGPTIRAEVGDKIKVVFRNRTRIPQSVHAHGVFYDKHSEGTPYADGTRGRDKADDVVAPGRSHTYVWEVPERAGPGRGDLSSVLWMYHGHVDEAADTESNLMHSINGYVYGNGPLFEVRRRERVRWHTFSMGTEVDLHTPHWHGNVVTTGMGMRSDVTALLPGQMMSADMQPDAAGVWLFHCHVNDHITAGMQARYAVR